MSENEYAVLKLITSPSLKQSRKPFKELKTQVKIITKNYFRVIKLKFELADLRYRQIASQHGFRVCRELHDKVV